MKYLYYYIWLIEAKFSFLMQKTLKFLLFDFLINLQIKVFKKKITKKNIEDTKNHMNDVKYDFPDGMTHWYAFVFTLIIIYIPIFILVFEVFKEYTRPLLDNNTQIKIGALALMPATILWYIIYINKSNKEWLQKKIDNKKKDFYL